MKGVFECVHVVHIHKCYFVHGVFVHEVYARARGVYECARCACVCLYGVCAYVRAR